MHLEQATRVIFKINFSDVGQSKGNFKKDDFMSTVFTTQNKRIF